MDTSKSGSGSRSESVNQPVTDQHHCVDQSHSGDAHPDADGAAQLTLALTPKQRVVLEALLVPGTTVPEAAEKAGVHRGTVNRWMDRDENFLAALNARSLEQIQLANAQMLSLVPRAVKAIEWKLNGGDGHLGMQLIKTVQELAQTLPTASAAKIAEERKVVDQQKQLKLDQQIIALDEERERMVGPQKEMRWRERDRIQEQDLFDRRYENECREFHTSLHNHKARELRKTQINQRVVEEVRKVTQGLLNPGMEQRQTPKKSPDAGGNANPGTGEAARPPQSPNKTIV